jgi:CRP/FNR family transcriptional regulator
MADIKSILSRLLPFWNRLTEAEKGGLAAASRIIRTEKGENIYGGGDCVGVMLALSGSFSVYILSEDGRAVVLYKIGAGELCVMSDSCAIKQISFDVHIDAVEISEALMISPSAFNAVMSKNIEIENFVLKHLADRFSDVMWAMQQLLFLKTDKRLAGFLLDEISQSKSDEIYYTHEAIANRIGTAREVVTRILKRFQEENVVALSRGKIAVIDKAALKAKAY